MDNDILTIETASTILDVNARFVRDAISKDELKAYRRESRTYILRKDLIAFIESGEDAKEAGKKNAKRKEDTEE